MALAAWSRAGLLRKPLVGIVAGLLNDPWRRTRRLTTLPLLRRLQLVLYGPGEVEGLPRSGSATACTSFRSASTRVSGRRATATSERDVLAIGNDGHRDWDTLVAAAPSFRRRYGSSRGTRRHRRCRRT